MVDVSKAMQLIENWDSKVEGIEQDLERPNFVRSSVLGGAKVLGGVGVRGGVRVGGVGVGAVDGGGKRKITTMSPILLRRGRAIGGGGGGGDKKEEKGSGGAGGAGEAGVDNRISSQSPPRGHRHTRQLVENVEIEIDADGSVMVDEQR